MARSGIRTNQLARAGVDLPQRQPQRVTRDVVAHLHPIAVGHTQRMRQLLAAGVRAQQGRRAELARERQHADPLGGGAVEEDPGQPEGVLDHQAAGHGLHVGAAAGLDLLHQLARLRQQRDAEVVGRHPLPRQVDERERAEAGHPQQDREATLGLQDHLVAGAGLAQRRCARWASSAPGPTTSSARATSASASSATSCST
jgi:hypothetical protein